MQRKVSLILANSLVFLGLAAMAVHGQGKAPLPEWKADPEAVKKLGGAVEVEGYSIRVPKGYERQEPAATPPAMKVAGWAGPRRKDSTRASLALNVLTIPPGEVEKIKSMTLEQLSERLNQSVKNKYPDWKQDEPEKSTIGGVEFVRIHWSGTSAQNNRRMRGLSYIAVDGGRILQLSSQDPVPDADKTLPVAESAILSLKSK